MESSAVEFGDELVLEPDTVALDQLGASVDMCVELVGLWQAASGQEGEEGFFQVRLRGALGFTSGGEDCSDGSSALAAWVAVNDSTKREGVGWM